MFCTLWIIQLVTQLWVWIRSLKYNYTKSVKNTGTGDVQGKKDNHIGFHRQQIKFILGIKWFFDVISKFSWQFGYYILSRWCSIFAMRMNSGSFMLPCCYLIVCLLLIELCNVWFASLKQYRGNLNENERVKRITYSVWMNINCTFTYCVLGA